MHYRNPRTLTDALKSTMDQKANQILYKTATVIDTIKTKTEILMVHLNKNK